MALHHTDFVSTLYAERANILSAQGLLSKRLVALDELLAVYVAKTPSPATHSPETATKSTAARKDVPESDELASPVQNQDGGSLAPQNDRAGGTVEVSAGVESVTVGRAEQPVACPRSNGSQAGTQAPPVDHYSLDTADLDPTRTLLANCIECRARIYEGDAHSVIGPNEEFHCTDCAPPITENAPDPAQAGEVDPPPSASPATPSTAARKDGQERPIAKHGLTGASVNGGSLRGEGETTAPAGTQAPPVDTNTETPAPAPGSEAAVDDADAGPAGEAPAPDASPAPVRRKPAPRGAADERNETANKRAEVARLNAKHPELTPEEAAARLLMPLITLRTFTAELGIEWSAARRADPPAPTERRPTKLERIRLMHEAHPTWTARMIANELGEKETTVSTLLAGIRRAERERAVEEVVEKEPER